MKIMVVEIHMGGVGIFQNALLLTLDIGTETEQLHKRKLGIWIKMKAGTFSEI